MYVGSLTRLQIPVRQPESGVRSGCITDNDALERTPSTCDTRRSPDGGERSDPAAGYSKAVGTGRKYRRSGPRLRGGNAAPGFRQPLSA